MKKSISKLVLLCMVISLTFFGCSNIPNEIGELNNGNLETSANNGTSDKEIVDTDLTAKLSVCNLVNGYLGDLSIFDSAESGLVQLAEEGIIDYKTIQMGGTDAEQPRWLSILDNVSESAEYDIIVCGTPQYSDYVKTVATTYPNQKYLVYDMDISLPNVISITYAQNDMGFLIGVVASEYAKLYNNKTDNVIGFVGGMEIDTINDFLWGYIEGTQYIDPKIKIDAQYVGNFWDTATAKEITNTMIEAYGCNIIWGVASAAGIGAAESAYEHGIKFIGVDSDQEVTFQKNRPELSEITLTSGLKNVGKSFIYIIDKLNKKEIEWGTHVKLGIKEDGVGIAEQGNYKSLPVEIRNKVDEVKNKIIQGEILVGSAFGNDITNLRSSVSPRIH